MIYDAFTVWLREMIRFWRSKSRVVGGLAMPFLWLAIMGTGLSSIVPGIGGASYIEFLIPGIIGMTLLFSSMFSGISVIIDKQFGFMKEILVAPISRLSIMVGKTIGGATTALINGLIILLLAIIIGVHFVGFAGMLISIVFMLLISASFVSLGVAIASRMSDMSGFQMIMNFLIMPMFMLSGVFFPIDQTPTWMQTIAHFDPLFYGVDGLRGSLIGISILPLIVDLIVLSAFCISIVLIGTYLFSKSEL
jgi:ABC-2 type transport system permease protein